MTQKILPVFILLSVLGSVLYAHAQVFCEPPSIDVTLGDAELRTDQNFTCSYNSRICPIVFSDTNNDGVRDAGELVFRGVEVELTNDTETNIIYTEYTDNGENACFAPLTDGTTYRARVLNGSGSNWPSPIMTTTGYDANFPNIQEFDITTASGTQLAEFGFSPGGITLNVPTSVTLPQVSTSVDAQDTTTIINPIEVEDTRSAVSDWSVTGVIDNFVASDSSATIPIATNFTSTPGTITVLSGTGDGISGGSSFEVTSTSDPFTVFQGQNNNGNGEFNIEQSITLSVPPYTPAKDYTSTITYTLIN